MIHFGREIVCENEAELAEVARAFSKQLHAGDVCLMYGEVGAGKTFFTTHVYAALGGRPEITGSPSYTLVHEYPLTKWMVYHVDLYRLEGLVDEDDISQDQWMFPERGISFIEWAERLGDWLPERGYRIELRHLDEGRGIRIERVGE
jgi:tRNA threonylcarbamoyladenosine biosynthesis protein TsaE